jgi:hypothetical protein
MLFKSFYFCSGACAPVVTASCLRGRRPPASCLRERRVPASCLRGTRLAAIPEALGRIRSGIDMHDKFVAFGIDRIWYTYKN